MINRIRDIRKQKGMTLAEVAAACKPPTTAQTIGRLETGMRKLWLRQMAPEEAPKLINRDVLVPRSGGRFAYGRLIDRQGALVGLLPPGAGQRQIVVDNPAWLAVAEMLVRKL